MFSGYTSEEDDDSVPLSESEKDSAIDTKALLRDYKVAFGATRISMQMFQSTAVDAFSLTLTLALTASLVDSITLTHAMGRGDPAIKICEPHFTLTLMPDASICPLGDDMQLRERVRNGSKLEPLDKARLLALPALVDRAAYALALITNRCRQSMQGVRMAALPVSFKPHDVGPGQAGHANLLALHFEEDHTLVEIFEPNGRAAYLSGGLGDVLESVPDRIAELNLLDHPVRVEAVGTGIQTAIGTWETTSHYHTEQGYPVCSAVCVWAFSKFLTSEYSSLKEFDVAFNKELRANRSSRHRLQLEFSSYLKTLAAWVQGPGRVALRDALLSHFRHSNVTNLTIARGGRPLRVAIV